MDLYQIQTFVTVAREGSITRASARLHLSQPAVSAHIKAMEDALGLSLLLFSAHGFTPQRIISADRQDITKTLVASGLGVGLLHADSARAAQRAGEVELIVEAEPRVRVLFAYLDSRAHEPILAAAASILRAAATD